MPAPNEELQKRLEIEIRNRDAFIRIEMELSKTPRDGTGRVEDLLKINSSALAAAQDRIGRYRTELGFADGAPATPT